MKKKPITPTLRTMNDTAQKYHDEGYDLDREKSTDRLLVFVKSEEVKED